MRVIAGTFKGRRLVAPRGWATRPTADRIKESVFNILAGEMANKRVLDLFAGTGALGIEALSRGASFAVFVDHQKAALETMRHNIQTLKLTDRARIVKWDILRGLHFLKSDPEVFDLVFMDPPYETNALMPVLSSLAACGSLSPNVRIVVEHSLREAVDPLPASLVLTDQRRFGKTLVSFIHPML